MEVVGQKLTTGLATKGSFIEGGIGMGLYECIVECVWAVCVSIIGVTVTYLFFKIGSDNER